MTRGQEEGLPQRQADAVVEGVRGQIVPERAAHVVAEAPVGRYPHAELREAPREVERPGPAEEIEGGPPALDAKAVHRAVAHPHADATAGPFTQPHQHAHGRVARIGGGGRVGGHYLCPAEKTPAAEVPPRLIQPGPPGQGAPPLRTPTARPAPLA